MATKRKTPSDTRVSEAPEQRTIDVDVQDIDTRGRTLVGYAAVYNAVSEDLGGFTERIAPGAFGNVLDADVRALLNHDPNQVLGRTRSGTLRLHDEQRGLRFEIDIPDSPLGENVRASVARGDIDGASFRFTVDRDSWDGDLRTVESVRELKDITVATFGAYPAASVELRTRPTDQGEAQGDNMGDQPDNQQQQTTEQPEESRGLEVRNPGSLRVEERAERPMFQTMTEAFRSRGFPGHAASITWDEYRTFVWSAGTVLTDLNPTRVQGVPLGMDTRYAYPAFPSTSVDSATTAVQVLRQSARVLPAGTAIVRPLDAVTSKPATAGTAEVSTVQLSQVAAIETNVPEIILQQPLFQSLVETDLRFAINEGYDALVLDGLSTAGTVGTSGTALIDVRRAITTLQASGYQPDTLVIDSQGAEALDLMQTSGSEGFFIWSPGNYAPAIWGLNRRVTKARGTAVVDSTSFGRLYSSPLALQRFEVDAGSTNRSNVRLEGHAAFSVERVAAAIRIT